MSSNQVIIESSEHLSPKGWGLFLQEVLRSLLYQKIQIPYPFEWLESFIYKISDDSYDMSKKSKSLAFKRYREKALATFNAFHNMSTNLSKEFEKKNEIIEEVSIVFGATLLTAKEIYSFKLPLPSFQRENKDNVKRKLLRKLFLSEEWMRLVEKQIQPTNVYVIIKKLYDEDEEISLEVDPFFVPKDNIHFTSSAKKLTVCFEKCDSEDLDNTNESEDCLPLISYSHSKWFVSKQYIKGFKDVFINKVSISNL